MPPYLIHAENAPETGGRPKNREVVLHSPTKEWAERAAPNYFTALHGGDRRRWTITKAVLFRSGKPKPEPARPALTVSKGGAA